MADVEAIERATIAAVAPREVLEIGGWLVALNEGTIRRAASAVPLSHELAADLGVFDRIEAAFAGRGWRRPSGSPTRQGWRASGPN